MTQTLSVTLSDAVIKRHINNPSIRQLKDPRYPLRLRFNADRTRASWHVIKYAEGGTRWRKAGAWPELSTKALLQRLPQIQAELAVNPLSNRVRVSTWETVGDVLHWYATRTAKNGRLSKSRKSTIKSVINRHLVPLIGGVSVVTINHAVLDECLMWPLQERYSLSFVRLVLSVMKQAFKQAHKLGLIESNPTAAFRFGDFIDGRSIAPKPGRLRADVLGDVLETLTRGDNPTRVLLVMMVLHGTRIGETRLAKWVNINIEQRQWLIPAENTKPRREHRLPLTDQAVELLTRHRDWQRERGYTGVYLFPDHNGKPVSAVVASQWVKVVSGGSWSSHDLRKLARTIWADLGVDYMVGEVLLNHALSKLDRTYIHTFVERQTEAALLNYHEWLLDYGLKSALAETTPRPTRNRKQARAW